MPSISARHGSMCVPCLPVGNIVIKAAYNILLATLQHENLLLDIRYLVLNGAFLRQVYDTVCVRFFYARNISAN